MDFDNYWEFARHEEELEGVAEHVEFQDFKTRVAKSRLEYCKNVLSRKCSECDRECGGRDVQMEKEK